MDKVWIEYELKFHKNEQKKKKCAPLTNHVPKHLHKFNRQLITNQQSLTTGN